MGIEQKRKEYIQAWLAPGLLGLIVTIGLLVAWVDLDCFIQ